MKKLFIFFLLITGFIATAQGTIPSYPGVKLTKLTNGAKEDSVLVVNGSSKLVKQLPTSAIKGTTNLDQLASPTNITVFSSTGNDAVLPLVDGTNAGLMPPASKTKLDGIEAGAQVNVPTNLDKIASPGGVTILSSTGNSTVIPLVSETNAGLISSGKILKLDGIATGATANQTDAYLLSRANHTGVQPISTITDLQTALDSKVDKVAGERLINATEITKLSNQSGVNTGDQDLSGLVVKNTAITAGTNTKITYDSKGLVTGGTSLIASDIPTLNQNTTGTASTITGNITESQVTNLVADLSNKQSTSQKNTANGYAGLGADGKLISSQLPSITISDTFVTASQAAMLALIAETGDVSVRTDLNKSFILKGTNPTVLADWQELLTPTSEVTTVFGRNGAVTAQTGDYTADQITETATRKFQTASQNTVNDATSSIQTQLNGKQASLGFTPYNATNPAGYISSFTETDPNVPAYSKSLSAFSVIKSSTDALYEPLFSKLTAFNKNFGTAAGTVAEGNDYRILNGQTAFGWGNNRWYDGWVNAPGYDANTIAGSKSGFTYSNNAPSVGALVHFDAGGYGLQLNTDYGSGTALSFRSRNGDVGTWNSWRGIITDGNFNSYAPTLTGGGASGTWGINITGNAGSATNWGGLSADFSSYSTTPYAYPVYDAGVGKFRLSDATAMKSYLGLGSNAYTSTAYLPLTGGTLTGSFNSTYNQYGYINRTVSNFHSKQVGSAGDYIQHVILLHPVYNGALIEYNQCDGIITKRRGGTSTGLNTGSYKIKTSTGYNSQSYSLESTSGGNGELYICNYNGVKYVALMTDYSVSGTEYGFDGYMAGDANSLLVVGYRNSQTSAVLNSEINNSLALITGYQPTNIKGTVNASSFVTTGGTSSQLVKGDGGLTVGYKVYTALLNQSGTSAPTATVLDNTLGGTVVWTRSSTGQYVATLTGAFPSAKVVIFTQTGYNTANNQTTYTAWRSTSNAVVLNTIVNIIGTGIIYNDGLLADSSIEIRVYN